MILKFGDAVVSRVVLCVRLRKIMYLVRWCESSRMCSLVFEVTEHFSRPVPVLLLHHKCVHQFLDRNAMFRIVKSYGYGIVQLIYLINHKY